MNNRKVLSADLVEEIMGRNYGSFAIPFAGKTYLPVENDAVWAWVDKAWGQDANPDIPCQFFEITDDGSLINASSMTGQLLGQHSAIKAHKLLLSNMGIEAPECMSLDDLRLFLGEKLQGFAQQIERGEIDRIPGSEACDQPIYLPMTDE